MQNIVNFGQISPGYLEHRLQELSRVEAVLEKAVKFLDLERKSKNIVALSRAVQSIRAEFPLHTGHIYDLREDIKDLSERRFVYRPVPDIDFFHFAYPPFAARLSVLRAVLVDLSKRQSNGASQVVMSDEELAEFNEALYADWSQHIPEVKKWKNGVIRLYDFQLQRYLGAVSTWSRMLEDPFYQDFRVAKGGSVIRDGAVTNSMRYIADGVVTNSKLASTQAAAPPINSNCAPVWLVAAAASIALIGLGVTILNIFGAF